MDHYSILEPGSSQAGPEAGVLQHAGRPLSVSAALAAANATAATSGGAPVVGVNPGLRFPGDDGHSLAEMARRDLDAALQLLADRAQYITGATGAAIALRRSNHNDMLCRASAGSNAPELGALLSTEFGLSGESVRTRLTLRCDDAERDPRVNREGCRQLGISSVAVLPIVSDDGVLGVFELFSGKANAFDERDLSALKRLGEMVETAVKLVTAAPALPRERDVEAVEVVMGEFVADVTPAAEPATDAALSTAASPAPPKVETVAPPLPAAETEAPPPNVSAASAPSAAPQPKKPLLWSAELQTASPAQKPAEPDPSRVPPILRSLRKCQACNFPVSEGRALCVECEEKQWRGQLRYPRPAPKPDPILAPPIHATESAPRPSGRSAVARPAAAAAPAPSVITPAKPAAETQKPASAPVKSDAPAPSPAIVPGLATAAAPEATALHANPAQTPAPQAFSQNSASAPARPLFSIGMASQQSWFSANKYILATLLVVAGVVAGIVFLR